MGHWLCSFVDCSELTSLLGSKQARNERKSVCDCDLLFTVLLADREKDKGTEIVALWGAKQETSSSVTFRETLCLFGL